VEDEDVCLFRRGSLAEPELLQDAANALRVVRVHLAPEGGDEVPPHGATVPARGSSQLLGRLSAGKGYLAYSIARDSRITVTLICPGYSSCCSISRAISCERSAASSSPISSGLTITRTSRPAWSA